MFSQQWIQRLLSSGKRHYQFDSHILLSSFSSSSSSSSSYSSSFSSFSEYRGTLFLRNVIAQLHTRRHNLEDNNLCMYNLARVDRLIIKRSSTRGRIIIFKWLFSQIHELVLKLRLFSQIQKLSIKKKLTTSTSADLHTIPKCVWLFSLVWTKRSQFQTLAQTYSRLYCK